jgi:hypothetical protein
LRNRFELYPRTLRQRLPRIRSPLADKDPDRTLDLQAAFEQVCVDGRYARRVRYDQRYKPKLSPDNQTWANEFTVAFRAARPDLFPP